MVDDARRQDEEVQDENPVVAPSDLVPGRSPSLRLLESALSPARAF